MLTLCGCSLQRTMRVWQHSTGKILKTLSLPKNMSAGELLGTPHVKHILSTDAVDTTYNAL
jgi:hypothetical protein